mmetsp:Transcript_518/g.575  ORF Transcript_518/g.575 Transcript_518/m.575 type:complete len:177 (-) Transcript_518:314-844(-)
MRPRAGDAGGSRSAPAVVLSRRRWEHRHVDPHGRGGRDSDGHDRALGRELFPDLQDGPPERVAEQQPFPPADRWCLGRRRDLSSERAARQQGRDVAGGRCRSRPRGRRGDSNRPDRLPAPADGPAGGDEGRRGGTRAQGALGSPGLSPHRQPRVPGHRAPSPIQRNRVGGDFCDSS